MKLSMRRVAALSSAAALSIVLSGCGALSSSSNSTFSTGVGTETMTGKAMGGLQPISGATIQLYAMGTTGYGSFGTLYATTTTSATGSWGFTRDTIDAPPNTNHGNSGSIYSCASGTEQQMYVIASGGNTTGSGSTTSPNNPAAILLAVLGPCHNLGAGTRVILNEVVTAGSMVALQQYFNATNHTFGRPSSGTASLEAIYQAGLTNAINMVGNLVDIPRGHAIQAINSPSGVAGITQTGTPEYQKLNTIANILSSCVNSSYSTTNTTNDTPSTACSTLFTNAVPPTSFSITSQPSFTFSGNAVDIAQAAYFMSINPVEIVSNSQSGSAARLINLFGLQTPTSPFSPALSTTAQPNDWTIGINFIPMGSCSSPTVAAGVTANTPPLMTTPFGMAIDKVGNIWVGSSTSSDVLAQFNPAGAPTACVGGTYSAGRNVAIDVNGNIWYSTSQGVVEYVLDTNNSNVGSVLLWPVAAAVKAAGIAADTQGNIFFGNESATSGAVNFAYGYIGAQTYGTTANPGSTPFAATQLSATAMTATISGTAGSATVPIRGMAVTSTGAVYETSSATTASGSFSFTPTATPGAYIYKQLSLSGGESTAYGLALNSNGEMVSGNSCCANAARLYKVASVAGTYTTSTYTAATTTATKTAGALISASSNFAGGLGAHRVIAVDGANNIWAGSGYNVGSSSDTNYPIGENDTYYNDLSPGGNKLAACTANNACPVGGGFSKSFLNNTEYGLAIDPSGNVWGTTDTTYAPTASTPTTPSLFVIVGAAVPKLTPTVSFLPTVAPLIP